MDKDIVEKMVPFLQGLRFYHRHEVVGIEKIPKNGAALIVANHSLATYDVVLLATAIYVERKRIVKPLIDKLFFKVPKLGEFMTLLGAKQGSPHAAQELLEGGSLVCVAPGGMREALRPYHERYQIKWDRRKGFAKVAIKSQAPVILAACPKADDIFKVYPSLITKLAYQFLRVPVFLARGIGPTILPKPVKLVHYLSEPITPPLDSDDPDVLGKRIQEFHTELVLRMKKLMEQALEHQEVGVQKQLPKQVRAPKN